MVDIATTDDRVDVRCGIHDVGKGDGRDLRIARFSHLVEDLDDAFVFGGEVAEEGLAAFAGCGFELFFGLESAMGC